VGHHFAHELGTANGIEYTVDHDVLERLRGVQRTVMAVLNDGTNVDASGR
jgi:hypothetical protein